jgi:hypothetical protein
MTTHAWRALALALAAVGAAAHVILASPRAVFNNDFLSTGRSASLCGAARLRATTAPVNVYADDAADLDVVSRVTPPLVGDVWTVNWLSAYPHLGAARISLLSCDAAQVASAADTASGVCVETALGATAQSDTAAQSLNVSFAAAAAACADGDGPGHNTAGKGITRSFTTGNANSTAFPLPCSSP